MDLVTCLKTIVLFAPYKFLEKAEIKKHLTLIKVSLKQWSINEKEHS